MKPARLRAFVFFACIALFAAACAPEGAGSPNAAATVNGEEIPIAEVQERFDAVRENPQFAEQLEGEEGEAFEQQVQAEILTGLIRSRLLHQGAEELGVELTEEDIDAKREEIIEEVGGEEAFEQIVEDNNLTEETIRSQLRDLAMQDLVGEELTADLAADDEEVQAAYDETYGTASARHILTETEDEANQVLERLEAGEDFGELAAEVSTDPSASENQGDLGEFSRDQMVPEFSDAVFAAEEGETIGPVESQFGFHVIEVLEIDEGPPIEDVEDELREDLLSEERDQAVQEWLVEQSQAAEVTVNPRFGEWDGENGRVVPEEDALGDVEEDAEPGVPGAPEDPGAADPRPSPAPDQPDAGDTQEDQQDS
ncbi:MAG TPA: peptidylprolyl isomerase [Egibacteraceae bacterium]|nr:peptidylprolyl isomerase [Egibacteraceae bacterium]